MGSLGVAGRKAPEGRRQKPMQKVTGEDSSVRMYLEAMYLEYL